MYEAPKARKMVAPGVSPGINPSLKDKAREAGDRLFRGTVTVSPSVAPPGLGIQIQS